METYNDYLAHHGIQGQKWGHRNGPPYPLVDGQRSSTENKLNKTSKSAKAKGNDMPKSAKKSSSGETKMTRKEKKAAKNQERLERAKQYAKQEQEFWKKSADESQKEVDALQSKTSKDDIMTEIYGTGWRENERALKRIFDVDNLYSEAKKNLKEITDWKKEDVATNLEYSKEFEETYNDLMSKSVSDLSRSDLRLIKRYSRRLD